MTKPYLCAEVIDVLSALLWRSDNSEEKSRNHGGGLGRHRRHAGLLGQQYVGFDPGGSEDSLREGSEIAVTQSALVLEEVIGQFIYGKAQEGAN